MLAVTAQGASCQIAVRRRQGVAGRASVRSMPRRDAGMTIREPRERQPIGNSLLDSTKAQGAAVSPLQQAASIDLDAHGGGSRSIR
jgi:hypothetical protein